MINIESVSNKLSLIYGNCHVLSDKSCIVKGADNLYHLYCIVDNICKSVRTYSEFNKINERYNEFRGDASLYGICDNMGSELRSPIYYRIGASKGNLVIVSDLSRGTGVLDLSANNYIIDCTYDEIVLYEDLNYMITSTDFHSICEVFDLSGKKVLPGRYEHIVVTDKVLICFVGGFGYKEYIIFDLKLNRLSNAGEKVIVNTENKTINVYIGEAPNGRARLTFRNLNFKVPILKKERLGL